MSLFVDLLPIILLLGFIGILSLFLLLLRSLATQREQVREGFSRLNLQLGALEAMLQEASHSRHAYAAAPTPAAPHGFDAAPHDLDFTPASPHNLGFAPAAPHEATDLGALLEGVDKLPSLDAPFGGNGRPPVPQGTLDLKLDS